MRPRNDVEILIDGRRKQLGIGRKELALATVGSQTTWTSRMLNPLMFRHEETQRRSRKRKIGCLHVARLSRQTLTA